MSATLFYLPDNLPEPFQAEGVTIYEHVGGYIGSRYMLNFSRPALVVGLAGERQLSSPSGTDLAGPGSVVLHPQGRVVSVAVDEVGETFRCLMVFAPIPILFRMVAQIAGNPTKVPNSSRLIGHFPRLLTAANAIADDLRDYGPSPCRLSEMRLEELLHLLALVGQGAALREWLSLASDPPTLRVSGVVEVHWQDNLTLTELAFLSGMSLAAFKRAFSKIYGNSPGRWLQERRMEQAAHLLGVEGHRPSAIWEKIGFSSHSVFAQSFRRHFGITPADYRSIYFGASPHSNGADENTPMRPA
ncbi:helix-turn-helix transcriptional regulator [Devosia sp. CAU 1758]